MVLAIYGTSGAGKETICTAEAIQKECARWSEIVYIDDTKEPGVTLGYKRYPYTVFKERYSTGDAEIHIAQGEPRHKTMLAQIVTADGYALANLIHPAAIVDHNTQLGNGVQIKMGAHVYPGCDVGDGVWVQAYATVRENVRIGAYSQVSAKAWVGKDVRIGHNSFIGMHANVVQEVQIGDYCVIAMGASVLHDVAAEEIMIGNPARKMGVNRRHTIF